MSKSRHTEAQMIGALKQLEAGRKAEDVAREIGVSKHTIYAWKAKYGGDGCERGAGSQAVARREHEVEEAGGGSESGQGDAQGGDRKKRMELVEQRSDANWLRLEYTASARRVCGLMGMAVSSYRYRATGGDEELRKRLVELAREKPRFGYRRLQVLLQRGGERVNHKRVHRVYREAGLSLQRKKRKHCVRVGQPLLARTAANQEWALDFVHAAVECGRVIRVLSVVDAYTRECPALEVDTSFASRRVTRVLEQVIAERGVPGAIRVDNGPEFTSRHFLAWCVEWKIELVHIQPGKPTQNARVESFHGRLREECLNVSWFQNLFDAKRKIAAWRREYNEERPHSSLGYLTPNEFAARTARASCGNDAGEAALENASAFASGVSHIPTAPAAAILETNQDQNVV